MFIGYPRSGHSLVGSLLNAHPEMVIAHELNALKYVADGVSRTMLYSLILEQDKYFASIDRHWTGYDYSIPNQWQGQFQKIRVIGDKKGAVSSRELEKDPLLIDRLQNLTKTRICIIHIVRNPYDNITTMFNRRKNKNDALFEETIDRYFHRASLNEDIIAEHEDKILTMKHEDFIAQPQSHLNRAGEFLGVTCSDDYLNACAKIVNNTPSRSRSKVQWSAKLIDRVAERIEKISFLKGYTFSS